MKIIYGCDCNKQCNVRHIAQTPVAYLIERDGVEMKVCTHCNVTGDKHIARLFDASTNMVPFIEYDTLGAMVMMIMLDDTAWATKQASTIVNK